MNVVFLNTNIQLLTLRSIYLILYTKSTKAYKGRNLLFKK